MTESQNTSPPLLSLALENINRFDTIDADNLSSMWNVFSKCKEKLENGRRLENMSWRLWYREAHLINNDEIFAPNTKASVQRDLTSVQNGELLKTDTCGVKTETSFMNSKTQAREALLDVPPLSSSVETHQSETSHPELNSRVSEDKKGTNSPFIAEHSEVGLHDDKESSVDSDKFNRSDSNSDDSSVTPRQSLNLVSNNRKKPHMMSTKHFTEMVEAFRPISKEACEWRQDNGELQSNTRQRQEKTGLQFCSSMPDSSSTATSTMPSHSTTPQTFSRANSFHSTPTPKPSDLKMTYQNPSQDDESDISSKPLRSRSFVRGFTPTLIVDPNATETETESDGEEISKENDVIANSESSLENLTEDQQRKAMFFLEGSPSDSEDSGFISQNTILNANTKSLLERRSSSKHSFSDFTSARSLIQKQQTDSKESSLSSSMRRSSSGKKKVSKKTSFRESVEDIATFEAPDYASDADSENTTTIRNINYAMDINSSAILESDDNDDDWNSVTSESASNSLIMGGGGGGVFDSNNLFAKRSESVLPMQSSRRASGILTSRPSLLSTLLNGRMANSRSSPSIALKHSSLAKMQLTKSMTLPIKNGQNNSQTPIIVNKEMKPANQQSPHTTRRNMLAAELSESLRRNLMWEKQQKTFVNNNALRRRHTTMDMNTLANNQYGIDKKESNDREDELNMLYSESEYNVAGW